MEDNRNISHKEDQKERIQGLYKFCNDCGKGFHTQTSLQKHRYLHRQLKLVSDMCGQGFTFISTLKQCKITNRTIATLPSMHKGCDRIFNNLGDLIHMWGNMKELSSSLCYSFYVFISLSVELK